MPPLPPTPTAPSPAAAAALTARAARRAGLATSAAFLATGAAVAVATGVVPAEAVAAAAALPLAGVAAAKAVLGDALFVDGGPPPSLALAPRWPGPGPRPDATPSLRVVRDAGGGRGRGVVAAEAVPAGAYLGCYEGDLLDAPAFWARYPDGTGAVYAMGVGREWCVDGAAIARAADAAPPASPPPPYSPCFINHSSRAPNVARVTRVGARRVDLYAARRIEAGVEVLLDYGSAYWAGREGEVVEAGGGGEQGQSKGQ